MSVTVNAGEAETVGEPDEGKLHVRFDEGRLGTDRVRGLWRTTRRWVTAGERSSALNPVPHQPPTPHLTQAIRQHASEVSGFVRDGMPAMMGG